MKTSYMPENMSKNLYMSKNMSKKTKLLWKLDQSKKTGNSKASHQSLGHVVPRVLHGKLLADQIELGVRGVQHSDGRGSEQHDARGELGIKIQASKTRGEDGNRRPTDPELQQRGRGAVEVVGDHVGRHGEHL